LQGNLPPMQAAEGRERKARGYPLARSPLERNPDRKPVGVADRHSRAVSENEDRRATQKRERERLKAARRQMGAGIDDDDGGFQGPPPKENPGKQRNIVAMEMMMKDVEEEEAARKLKETLEKSKPLYLPGEYPFTAKLADMWFRTCTRCCNSCICRCIDRALCGAVVRWCAKESRYMSLSPRIVHGFAAAGLVIVLLCFLTAGVGCKCLCGEFTFSWWSDALATLHHCRRSCPRRSRRKPNPVSAARHRC
jgi:hypothetical protein